MCDGLPATATGPRSGGSCKAGVPRLHARRQRVGDAPPPSGQYRPCAEPSPCSADHRAADDHRPRPADQVRSRHGRRHRGRCAASVEAREIVAAFQALVRKRSLDALGPWLEGGAIQQGKHRGQAASPVPAQGRPAAIGRGLLDYMAAKPARSAESPAATRRRHIITPDTHINGYVARHISVHR